MYSLGIIHIFTKKIKNQRVHTFYHVHKFMNKHKFLNKKFGDYKNVHYICSVHKFMNKHLKMNIYGK